MVKKHFEYRTALILIKKILQKPPSSSVLQDVVDILYTQFKKYSWVGIYLVQGEFLVLGPWRGTHATEHVQIPLGKGICGAAVQTGKTEVVSDVSQDTRYLACFVSTRSEIVVPIKTKSHVVGEIDIDSDVSGAFTDQDVTFLEEVATLLGPHIFFR